uniref:hypothetical protein n=2 Tax=Endozoicomonas acroporae TaxID=1701104 RepID=UPI0019D6252B
KKEPAPPDIPVYLEPIGYQSTDNHGEPVADGEAGIATGGSNPLVGNEKEPAPPDPVYLEPIGYESTDNHGEPVADGQAGIATGSNSVANTGKPTRPGTALCTMY